MLSSPIIPRSSAQQAQHQQALREDKAELPEHPISLCPIPSHPTPSCCILSYPIPSHSTPSRPNSSHPISSHLIPSCCVLSYPIPSHPMELTSFTRSCSSARLTLSRGRTRLSSCHQGQCRTAWKTTTFFWMQRTARRCTCGYHSSPDPVQQPKHTPWWTRGIPKPWDGYLQPLELLTAEEALAGCLEEDQLLSYQLVTLLLQPGENTCLQEHLCKERAMCTPGAAQPWH